jgi:hypothetical protein
VIGAPVEPLVLYLLHLDSIPEVQLAILQLSHPGVPIEDALLLGQPLIDLRIAQIQDALLLGQSLIHPPSAQIEGTLLLGQPLIQLRIAKIIGAPLLCLPLHELGIALLLGDIEAPLSPLLNLGTLHWNGLKLTSLNLGTLHWNRLKLTSLYLRSLYLGSRRLHDSRLLHLNAPVLHLRPLVLLLQILLLHGRRCVCPDCGRRGDSYGEEKRARHPSDTLRNPCYPC